MKKNKMMRIASFLLVAVLMSTSAISGTFAKYVTTASASDTARVAKWGITMDSTDTDMFVDTYQSGTPPVNTVKGKDNDVVVAPGTSGSANYKVTGTPETKYVVDFKGTTMTSDVVLKKDSVYTYPAVLGIAEKTVTISNDYYPVKYRVTVGTDNGTVGGGQFEKNVAKTFVNLKAAMDALAATTVTYEPTVGCDLVVTIEWEWAFDEEGSKTIITDPAHTCNDTYDTILGDLMSGTSNLTTSATEGMADANGYNLTIDYTLTMTATQID